METEYRIKGVKKLSIAPPPPFKFLDIATKINLYEMQGLTSDMKQSSVLHPRSNTGIPVPNTFYEAVHAMLARTQVGAESWWCDFSHWTSHSPMYDFSCA